MADHTSPPRYGVLPLGQWPPVPAPASQSQQTEHSSSSFPPSSSFPSTDYASIQPSNNATSQSNSIIPGLGGIFAPPPPSMPFSEAWQQSTSSAVPPRPSSSTLLNPTATSRSPIPGLGENASFAAHETPGEVAYGSSKANGTVLSTTSMPSIATPETAMAREEGELSDGELEEDSIGGGGTLFLPPFSRPV